MEELLAFFPSPTSLPEIFSGLSYTAHFKSNRKMLIYDGMCLKSDPVVIDFPSDIIAFGDKLFNILVATADGKIYAFKTLVKDSLESALLNWDSKIIKIAYANEDIVVLFDEAGHAFLVRRCWDNKISVEQIQVEQIEHVTSRYNIVMVITSDQRMIFLEKDGGNSKVRVPIGELQLSRDERVKKMHTLDRYTIILTYSGKVQIVTYNVVPGINDRIVTPLLFDERIETFTSGSYTTYFTTERGRIFKYSCYSPSLSPSVSPSLVDIPEEVVQVSDNINPAYFITASGSLFVIGNNWTFERGGPSNLVSKVELPEKVRAVDSFRDQAVVVSVTGKLYSCKFNFYGSKPQAVDEFYVFKLVQQ